MMQRNRPDYLEGLRHLRDQISDVGAGRDIDPEGSDRGITLLSFIRHGGRSPWDNAAAYADAFDLVIDREDYEGSPDLYEDIMPRPQTRLDQGYQMPTMIQAHG